VNRADFYRYVRASYVKNSITVVLVLSLAIWLLDIFDMPLDGAVRPSELAEPAPSQHHAEPPDSLSIEFPQVTDETRKEK